MNTLAGLRVTLLAGTLGQGGAERQLFLAAATLKRAGAFPRVLTLGRDEFWEAPLRDLGIPVEWVGARTAKAGRLVTILRSVARHRPDVVQSYHFYVNPYAAVTARMLRLPDLGAIRSNGTADLASVDGLLGRLCLRLPRLLVANSQAALTTLAALGVSAERLRLLPNVVDTAAFTPVSGGDGTGPFRVIAIGRLDPPKRFDRALRVVAALRAQVTRRVQLTIAGMGPQRAALEAMVAELGLGDVVTFAGALTDVRPVLRDADCLLLTSDHEGTPNVILEAMASALPVVATAVGGIGALVDPHRTGFLCAPDDEVGLCSALVALANDPALAERLGRGGRQRVASSFGLPTLDATLRHLYGEVVPKATRNRALSTGRPGVAP